MPRSRGKATKGCQTDTVFLSEEQVEKIVTRNLSHLEHEIKRLQGEIKDLKSIRDESTLDSAVLNTLQSEIGDLKLSSNKLIKDNDALNNLQQATDIQIEQFQARLDQIEEDNSCNIQKLYKRVDAKEGEIYKMQKRTDELEQINKMNNLRIAALP